MDDAIGVALDGFVGDGRIEGGGNGAEGLTGDDAVDDALFLRVGLDGRMRCRHLVIACALMIRMARRGVEATLRPFGLRDTVRMKTLLFTTRWAHN